MSVPKLIEVLVLSIPQPESYYRFRSGWYDPASHDAASDSYLVDLDGTPTQLSGPRRIAAKDLKPFTRGRR